MGEYNSKTA